MKKSFKKIIAFVVAVSLTGVTATKLSQKTDASVASTRNRLAKKYHLKAYTMPKKWRGVWKGDRRSGSQTLHIGKRTFYTTTPKEPKSLLKAQKNARTYKGKWWKYTNMSTKKGSQYIMFVLPGRHVQGHRTMGVGGPSSQGEDFFLTKHKGKRAIAALTPSGRNIYFYELHRH